MATIRVMPLDIDFHASDGDTIMGAAQANGYYWPTTCGGEARCTTCACEIIDGRQILSPMGRAERRALVAERGERVLSTNIRLACQARVRNDGIVTVSKAGIRKPDAERALR